MEQKKSEQFTPEEMLQFMDLSDCAMFTVLHDSNFKLLYGNKKFYSIIKYTPEEFEKDCGNRLMEIIMPEEKQKIRALIARQSAMGGLLHLEFRIKRKDGVVQWISLSAQAAMVGGSKRYYCSCLNVTRQKQNLEEISNAKREVDVIANSILGGVIKLKASDYTLLYSNEGFFRLAGYSRSEYLSLFGNHCNHVIHPEDAKMVDQLVRSAVDNNGSLGFEYRIIDKSGEVRWSYVNGKRVEDHEGSPVFLCIIMDITARKKLQEQLEDNVRRSKYLHRYMSEVEWTYYIDTKEMWRSGDLEGSYCSSEMVRDVLDDAQIRTIVHPEDIEPIRQAMEKRCQEVGESQGIFRIKNNLGEFRRTQVSMISVSLSEGDKPDRIYGESKALPEENIYSCATEEGQGGQDNTDGFVLEIAKNSQSKEEDVITCMMSHEEFASCLREVLSRREKGEKFGILCCDINEFQKLNFHYGISAGNQILQLFGNILKESFSYKGICSRIRGDYFMLLFRYDGHSKMLREMSHMMRDMTEAEGKLSYKTYGSTIGIYLVQPEDEDINKMIECADLARRSIKGTRGNHFAIYTEDLQNNQFYEEQIIQEISEAIQNHTMEICYQPRIQGTRENVIGCKVVPMVQSKNGEYISLEDIRRYVDRTPEIQQLVFYVLSSVCSTMGAWKAQGKKIKRVSLDITQGQLCLQNAVDRIDQIVKENKLEASDIIFEIQERYFRDLTPSFQMALENLHQRGYRFIISRFGMDHTAVQAIRHLPIYGIKFHGEFFQENMTNEKEILMFKRIVGMAHELGMAASCGGVNTKMQEDIARSIGCDILEGDMFYGKVRNDIYEKCFLEE